MDKNDCLQAMSLYWEEQTLRILRDSGILTAEEFLGILEIVHRQTTLRKVCCNP